MKKLFAGIGIAVFVMLLMWGIPAIDAATSSVESNSGTIATGSISADGSAVNVPIGWTPRYIVVTRVTDSMIRAEWQTGMAAASCLKTSGTGSTSYNTNAALMSLATVSCLSVYSGSTTTAKGFTMGADTTINVSGKTLRWTAFR